MKIIKKKQTLVSLTNQTNLKLKRAANKRSILKEYSFFKRKKNSKQTKFKSVI